MKTDATNFPIKGSDLFKYSITYRQTTPESLERDDFSDTGVTVKPTVAEMADILHASHLTYSIYSPTSLGVWESTDPTLLTSAWNKGISTYYDLHVEHPDGTPLTQKEHDFITALMNEGKYSYNKDDNEWMGYGGESFGFGGFIVGGILGVFLGYGMGHIRGEGKAYKRVQASMKDGGATDTLYKVGVSWDCPSCKKEKHGVKHYNLMASSPEKAREEAHAKFLELGHKNKTVVSVSKAIDMDKLKLRMERKKGLSDREYFEKYISVEKNGSRYALIEDGDVIQSGDINWIKSNISVRGFSEDEALEMLKNATQSKQQFEDGGSTYAGGGEIEDLENQLNHYKNILRNIDKYPKYNKKNVEIVISELEDKLRDINGGSTHAEGGEIIDVVDSSNRMELPKEVYSNGTLYSGDATFINGYNGYTSTKDDGYLVDEQGNYLTDKSGSIIRAKERRGTTLTIKSGSTHTEREETNNGTKSKIQEMYLDYANNFLTVERFAEHYDISEEKANRIIDLGREINERQASASARKKVWGVELRETFDSYWEEIADNLSKEEAEKFKADYIASGKPYHEIRVEIPLPFKGGGELRLDPQRKKEIRTVTFDLEGSNNERRNEVIRERIGSKHYDMGIAYADTLLANGGDVDEVEGLNVDEVVRHFLIASLWSSEDDDGDPLENNYNLGDIDEVAERKIKIQVIEYLNENIEIIKRLGLNEESIGHDLFLDSRGHGVGFWDRGYGDDGDILSESAKKIFPSEDNPYVGDDGKIYFYGQGGGIEGWKADSIKELRETEGDDELELDNDYDDRIEVLSGNAEYMVFENEDDAEQYAVERVREDLEENPEYFTEDWLIGHVDSENAERFFREVYEDWNVSYATDIQSEDSDDYENRLVEEMVERGLMTEEEAQSEEAIETAEERIMNFATAITDDQIDEGDGGYEHYKDNFGGEEAKKLLFEHNLIDINSASADAIATDGVGHFLAGYDFMTIHLPNDAVAYRTN